VRRKKFVHQHVVFCFKIWCFASRTNFFQRIKIVCMMIGSALSVLLPLAMHTAKLCVRTIAGRRAVILYHSIVLLCMISN